MMQRRRNGAEPSPSANQIIKKSTHHQGIRKMDEPVIVGEISFEGVEVEEESQENGREHHCMIHARAMLITAGAKRPNWRCCSHHPAYNPRLLPAGRPPAGIPPPASRLQRRQRRRIGSIHPRTPIATASHRFTFPSSQLHPPPPPRLPPTSIPSLDNDSYENCYFLFFFLPPPNPKSE